MILPASAFSLPRGEPQVLYSTLIALVVGITLFGAYLWWRDTRRELKLAAMRSDFVSSVSHELKTPLTSVQMLAETIRIRPLAENERNEYLDLILSESERLGRLLKNVLDFSIIEKGTKVYRMEPVELAPVIEAAVRCLQQPLREKNLKVVCSDAEVTLNADRDALVQALLNLLHNAIKYSSKDGQIEVRTQRRGGAHGTNCSPMNLAIEREPRHCRGWHTRIGHAQSAIAASNNASRLVRVSLPTGTLG